MSDNGFVTRDQLKGGMVRAYKTVECKSGHRFCLQTEPQPARHINGLVLPLESPAD